MLRDIDRGDSCLDGSHAAGCNTTAAKPGEMDIARCSLLHQTAQWAGRRADAIEEAGRAKTSGYASPHSCAENSNPAAGECHIWFTKFSPVQTPITPPIIGIIRTAPAWNVQGRYTKVLTSQTLGFVSVAES